MESISRKKKKRLTTEREEEEEGGYIYIYMSIRIQKSGWVPLLSD